MEKIKIKLNMFISNFINTMKKLPIYFIVLVIITLIIFLIGNNIRSQQLIFLAPIIIWGICLFEGIKDIKNNVFYVTFLLSVFLFLLGKPLIAILEFRNIISYVPLTFIGMAFASFSIWLSLILVYVGNRFYCYSHSSNYIEAKTKVKSKWNISLLRKISFLVMIISFIPICFSTVELFLFMQNHTYLEYFTTYSSNMNLLFKAISQFFFPSVMLYLATFPNKKSSNFALLLLILSNLGGAIAGTRSKIMIPIVFAFLYYFIRQYHVVDKYKTWLSKRKIIIIGVCIPFLCAGLYLYNFIRVDADMDNVKISNPIVSFIDQQGATFLMIGSAYERLDDISDNTLLGYTFGPIEDRLFNNRIGRKILGTPEISNQNKDTLKYSRNFSNQMSYAILGDLYFEGQGTGSSYIIELFYDYGYFGIVIFSFLLGYVLSALVKNTKSNVFITLISLNAIYNISFLPRANASLMFLELFNLYYIFTICLIIALYKVAEKTKLDDKIINMIKSKRLK